MCFFKLFKSSESGRILYLVQLFILSYILNGCNANKPDISIGNEEDMRGYFEGVKTPDAELEASKLLREKFSGYTVSSFNVDGNMLTQPTNGNYRLIHSVTIHFENSDVEASRIILNRNSLRYIFREKKIK